MYVFGRPSFIQRVQPCKMLILRQSYLPMLSCEVCNISFPPQILLHIVGAAAEIDCFFYIFTVNIVSCRLAAFLVQPHLS